MKKLGFLMLAIALMLGGAAFAQNVGDNSVYFTTYYTNNPFPVSTAIPDATVRVINDGDTGGNLWADFYVFDDSQELTECCACGITPDGLLSESVQQQLTSTPLTGIHKGRGVIKLISSSNCEPVRPDTSGGTTCLGDSHPGAVHQVCRQLQPATARALLRHRNPDGGLEPRRW